MFDTQKRILGDIQIMQMQMEAIGAPSPEDMLLGNYEKKTASSAAGDSKDSL